MITLGLVDSVDDNGVYVTMPGSRGLLRGPFQTLQNVTAGDRVLVVTTDDGEAVIVGQAAASASGVVDSAMIVNGTIKNEDVAADAAIAVSKLAGHPTTTVDNTIPRFHSTSGELQTSSVLIDDNNRLRVASGSTGGLEIGSSGVLALSGTGGPSGIAAPVGSTWRQTDANSGHGNLAGLLWNKVGTGTTEGTDWLPDFEGRWVAWSPTVTGFALGTGGTTTARYTRRGKTVTVSVVSVVGTSPTPGNLTVTYPTGLAPASSESFAATAFILDSGNTYVSGIAFLSSTILVMAVGTSGGVANIAAGVPITWSAKDKIGVTATYEIA